MKQWHSLWACMHWCSCLSSWITSFVIASMCRLRMQIIWHKQPPTLCKSSQHPQLSLFSMLAGCGNFIENEVIWHIDKLHFGLTLGYSRCKSDKGGRICPVSIIEMNSLRLAWPPEKGWNGTETAPVCWAALQKIGTVTCMRPSWPPQMVRQWSSKAETGPSAAKAAPGRGNRPTPLR